MTEPLPVMGADEFGNPTVNRAAARAEYDAACEHPRADAWVVGGRGSEVPVRDRAGRWQLYVWNPFTGEHGWLDLATDIVTLA